MRPRKSRVLQGFHAIPPRNNTYKSIALTHIIGLAAAGSGELPCPGFSSGNVAPTDTFLPAKKSISLSGGGGGGGDKSTEVTHNARLGTRLMRTFMTSTF